MNNVRKWMSLILAILMLLSCISMTVSCDYDRYEEEGRTDKEEQSDREEESTGTPFESDAESTDLETTTEAPESTETTHTHTLTAWSVLQPSTCQKEGVTVRMCTVEGCYYTEQDVLAVAEHQYRNGACAMCDAKDPNMPMGALGGLHYDNSVRILYWEDVEMPEFEQGEGSLNEVENAIYQRNRYTENRLGLRDLEWYGAKGNHGNMETFVEALSKDISSGALKYNIVATYSRTAAYCAIEGLLCDLDTIDGSYIDLSQTYWKPSGEDLLIGDSLYYVTGDISTNLLHMMYAMYCNMDMIAELTLADPYELVQKDQWTIDAFMRLCEEVYTEQDGDNKPSENDRYGFVTLQLHAESFYHGAGRKLFVPDASDVLVVSEDFSDPQTAMLVQDLQNFFASSDVSLKNPELSFADANALFTQNRLYFGARRLRNVQFTWMVLPMPMYDTKQDGYMTTVANPFTLWGISIGTDSTMRKECTAVLESLAMDAAAYTTSAVIASNLPESVIRSDDKALQAARTAVVLQLRESVVLDHGRIFPNTYMGTYIIDVFSKSVVGTTSWSDNKKSNLPIIKQSLKNVIKKLAS